MLSHDSLSNKPCHSERMYPNSVQFAVIGHKDGILLEFFFLFLLLLFFFLFFFLPLNVFKRSFVVSQQLKTNTFLKVPRIRDSLKIHNAALLAERNG